MGTIIYDKLNLNDKKIYDLMKKSFSAFSTTVNLGVKLPDESGHSIL